MEVRDKMGIRGGRILGMKQHLLEIWKRENKGWKIRGEVRGKESEVMNEAKGR